MKPVSPERRREVIYLRRLLREAYRAIDAELAAMGEDEWSQQPAMLRKERLLKRIEKALKR